MSVKAGDTVRIKNYAEGYNGRTGTVHSTNGFYVYVFPSWQPDNKEYPVELLMNEVEVV